MVKRKANILFLTHCFDAFSDIGDGCLRLPLNKIYSEEVNENLSRFGIGAIGI